MRRSQWAHRDFLSTLILCLLCLLAASPRCEAKTLRVISLYPGHTDNIAALGCESSIVAISHGDDLESLQHLPRLAANVSAEALLAHKPDIVFMRLLNQRANSGLIPILEGAGVRVHLIEPPTWEEFDDYLVAMAEILEVSPETGLSRLAELRSSVSDRVGKQTPGARRPSVFLEATAREIHTCSPNSWAAHVIAMCGGINAAQDAKPIRAGSPLAPWGVERAVALARGGLDIYLIQQGAMNASERDDVERRPWFPALEGVRLEFIPERYLSRPSLIGLERGAQMLVDMFYPEPQGAGAQ